ncbi:hypothetical protein [Actinomycetospora atypica]|uniref:Uncharacterized protein n=1 Tax=Actinomycetospora atypica TaxID=1290095 RepID=A0ABV9YTK8_9PSEU
MVAVEDLMQNEVLPRIRKGNVPTPYSSFGKLMRMVKEHERVNYIPSVFSPDEFGAVSKGTVAAERLTLKALCLVDDEYRPTRIYFELVGRDEEGRRELLRTLGQYVYAEMVALAERGAPWADLEREFIKRDMSGSTVAKATAFYSHYSGYARLPWSDRWPRPKASTPSGSSGPSETLNTTSRILPMHLDTNVLLNYVEADRQRNQESVPTTEQMRARYIALLLRVAEKSLENDGPSMDVLDRLERLLGFNQEAPGYN